MQYLLVGAQPPGIPLSGGANITAFQHEYGLEVLSMSDMYGESRAAGLAARLIIRAPPRDLSLIHSLSNLCHAVSKCVEDAPPPMPPAHPPLPPEKPLPPNPPQPPSLPPPWTPWQETEYACPAGFKNEPRGCTPCPRGQISHHACTAYERDENIHKACLRTCRKVPEGGIQWKLGQSLYVHCPPAGLRCSKPWVLRVRPHFYLAEGTWTRPYNETTRNETHAGTGLYSNQLTPGYAPIRCPYPQNCLGGTVFDRQCKNGSIGILCGHCDHGFYMLKHSCAKCPKSQGSLSSAIILTVCVIGVILLLVFSYLLSSLSKPSPSSKKQIKEAISTPLLTASSRIKSCLDGIGARLLWMRRRLLPEAWPRQISTVLKIIIGYLQMLRVFARMTCVQWPPIFHNFLEAMSNMISVLGIGVWVDEALMPYACHFAMTAYDYLWIAMLMPIICSIAMAVLAAAASLVKLSLGADGSFVTLYRSLRPRLWHLHFWLFLLLYPSISREVLSIFLCTAVGDEYFLNSDTRLKCYANGWGSWAFLASLGLCFYSIGLPLFAFLLTLYHRRTSNMQKRAWLRIRIELLLASYNEENWYFESIDLLRKLLLTGTQRTKAFTDSVRMSCHYALPLLPNCASRCCAQCSARNAAAGLVRPTHVRWCCAHDGPAGTVPRPALRDHAEGCHAANFLDLRHRHGVLCTRE